MTAPCLNIINSVSTCNHNTMNTADWLLTTTWLSLLCEMGLQENALCILKQCKQLPSRLPGMFDTSTIQPRLSLLQFPFLCIMKDVFDSEMKAELRHLNNLYTAAWQMSQLVWQLYTEKCDLLWDLRFSVLFPKIWHMILCHGAINSQMLQGSECLQNVRNYSQTAVSHNQRLNLQEICQFVLANVCIT